MELIEFLYLLLILLIPFAVDIKIYLEGVLFTETACGVAIRKNNRAISIALDKTVC